MGHEKHIRFVGLLGMFSSYDTFIERKCKKNVIKKAFDRQIFGKNIHTQEPAVTGMPTG